MTSSWINSAGTSSLTRKRARYALFFSSGILCSSQCRMGCTAGLLPITKPCRKLLLLSHTNVKCDWICKEFQPVQPFLTHLFRWLKRMVVWEENNCTFLCISRHTTFVFDWQKASLPPLLNIISISLSYTSEMPPGGLYFSIPRRVNILLAVCSGISSRISMACWNTTNLIHLDKMTCKD